MNLLKYPIELACICIHLCLALVTYLRGTPIAASEAATLWVGLALLWALVLFLNHLLRKTRNEVRKTMWMLGQMAQLEARRWHERAAASEHTPPCA